MRILVQDDGAYRDTGNLSPKQGNCCLGAWTAILQIIESPFCVAALRRPPAAVNYRSRTSESRKYWMASHPKRVRGPMSGLTYVLYVL